MDTQRNTFTVQDVIAAGLRWTTLLVLALWNLPSAPLKLFLLASLVFYLLTTLGQFARPNSRIFPIVGVFFDGLTASIVFILTKGIEGGCVWVIILPLITAGLFFNLKGYILAFICLIIAQGVIASLYDPLSIAFLFLLPWSLAAFLLGLGFFFLTQRLRWTSLTSKTRLSPPYQNGTINESERRKALYQIISTLSATLDYQRVLETALDMSAKALPSSDHTDDKLVLAVLMITNSSDGIPRLHVASSRRLTPSDKRITLEGSQGILSEALENRIAVIHPKPASDPELGRIVALRSCESVFCIPLRKNIEVYGVILFGHPRPDFFSEEITDTLQIIANQAMVAIENARLYHQLEQEKERILEIQDEARKKLARDLHDGPTQSVSALAMRVNFARRLLERNPSEAAEELFKIEELARRTTKEIRHMLFTLRPLVLESEGLIAALRSMAEKMQDTYNQNVIIQADERVTEALEMNKQSVIFAIAEEAVNNARKHAEADHIWVRLGYAESDIVLLEVQDDGNGFDPSEVGSNYDQRGSLGMVNMRERTELVNGVIRIESKPAKGTRIRVWVPLSESAADRLRKGQA
jgi:signal transduction histidine kinase